MGSSKSKNIIKKYKDKLLEWYRLYFHTIIVTVLIVFNMTFFLYNATLSYVSIVLSANLNLPYVKLHELSWPIFLFLVNIPLITWCYSTITQAIKKGYKNIIDWSKSKKGRVLSAAFNAIPFTVGAWLTFSRYTLENYTPYLSTIYADTEYFTVTTLDSLIVFLYLVPVFATPIIISTIIGEFMKKKSLTKQFFKWEPSFLARQSFNLKEDSCDVIIGWDKKTKKPIILKENERFLHELVCGATGSGKTSTSILPRIALDLIRIARGYKCSIILIEPKGDAVEDVLKIAKDLNIPDHYIKVIDPTKKTKHTIKFNPFAGDMAAAAEGFRGTLNSLTGDQDPFFAGQQEETAALFTMLAKIRFGNLANISHIQRMFTEPRYLANIAEQVREEVDKLKAKGEELSHEEKTLASQYDRVVSYFENEVLDYKTFTNKQGDREPRFYQQGPYQGQQEVENKKDKFVTGAKKYLNDISMNAMLTELMIAEGDEEILDLDGFLDRGGILLVNTALGELEELSILLGQFMIRQIQSSVFRRPREENGYKRIPTFLNIDEFPLYANENFERLLTLGRSYKVGTLIALQSLGQLERIVPGYKETILANASTKTVFGRGTYEDNEAFSNQFGEEERVEESLNESTSPMTQENPSWGFRHNTQRMLMPRFTPSEIQELEFKHCIVQPVNEDGSIGDATLAIGKFVNETGILKKFVNISNISLSTKKHKEVDVEVAERAKLEAPNIIKEMVGTKVPATEEQSITEFPEDNDTFTQEDSIGLNNEPDEDVSANIDTINNNLDESFDTQNLNEIVEIDFDAAFSETESISELENLNNEPEHSVDNAIEQEAFHVSNPEKEKTIEEIPEKTTKRKEEKTQRNTNQIELPLTDEKETEGYKNSTPTPDMEESITELLNKTTEDITEHPPKDDDKQDRQYNRIHEGKKPKQLEIFEEDEF